MFVLDSLFVCVHGVIRQPNLAILVSMLPIWLFAHVQLHRVLCQCYQSGYLLMFSYTVSCVNAINLAICAFSAKLCPVSMLPIWLFAHVQLHCVLCQCCQSGYLIMFSYIVSCVNVTNLAICSYSATSCAVSMLPIWLFDHI